MKLIPETSVNSQQAEEVLDVLRNILADPDKVEILIGDEYVDDDEFVRVRHCRVVASALKEPPPGVFPFLRRGRPTGLEVEWLVEIGDSGPLRQGVVGTPFLTTLKAGERVEGLRLPDTEALRDAVFPLLENAINEISHRAVAKVAGMKF